VPALFNRSAIIDTESESEGEGEGEGEGEDSVR
jgi:hypothetical protein